MSAEPNMHDLHQWVCWRSEERNGKKTKVPYSPSTGTRARSDDRTTWSTLSEARRAVEEEGHDGIGFVFTADDPFCGVDLDGCVDRQTGEIQPWAADILDRLDSYTEFSPSSEGLHIIVRAELPEGRRRGGGVEMYDRAASSPSRADTCPVLRNRLRTARARSPLSTPDSSHRNTNKTLPSTALQHPPSQISRMRRSCAVRCVRATETSSPPSGAETAPATPQTPKPTSLSSPCSPSGPAPTRIA